MSRILFGEEGKSYVDKYSLFMRFCQHALVQFLTEEDNDEIQNTRSDPMGSPTAIFKPRPCRFLGYQPPRRFSSNTSAGIGCCNCQTTLIGLSLSLLTRYAGPKYVNGEVILFLFFVARAKIRIV